MTRHMSEFYGQQEGERVLYQVVVHPLVHIFKLIRVVLMGLVLWVLFWIIGGGVDFSTLIRLMGMVLGLLVIAIGWWGVTVSEKKSMAFITDRRVVRFMATTPWTVNNRSIIWDEVVKVKTRSPNFIWRTLNIGSIVVHARSTVVPSGDQTIEQPVTNDDIQLDGIEYYQDLGNYLDKVLYLYKKEPAKMAELHDFVAKPKGKRY